MEKLYKQSVPMVVYNYVSWSYFQPLSALNWKTSNNFELEKMKMQEKGIKIAEK
jgi:hypothetical protein